MKSRPITANEAQAIEAWLTRPAYDAAGNCPWSGLKPFFTCGGGNSTRCQQLFPKYAEKYEHIRGCPCGAYGYAYVRARAQKFLRNFKSEQKGGSS